MPRPAIHRQPIVDAAVTLFRRQGYAATGLADIIALSGAPKGSLYHHFPRGKSAIAVAAIEEAGLRAVASLERLSDQAPDFATLVTLHARQLAGWMENSGYRSGCPITTVLLELAPQDRAVSDAGRTAFAARAKILSRRLEQEGWGYDAALRMARTCLATLQGALVQSRIERSRRPLLSAAGELTGLLADRVAAQAASSPVSR